MILKAVKELSELGYAYIYPREQQGNEDHETLID